MRIVFLKGNYPICIDRTPPLEPRWDVASQSRLYVDALVGDICRLNPYTKQSTCVHFDGVVPYRSNPKHTIVMYKRELRKLHWPTQTSVLLKEIEGEKKKSTKEE